MDRWFRLQLSVHSYEMGLAVELMSHRYVFYV